ncbi:hypothetical protein OGZ39_04410 [Lactococcus lactis]|uniref:Uncharacterized protein n=1 Tax=Lactococcus lactis TaxID=1358 RepID=A0A9X4ND22_9LACT|nr:hypothetical protein [Lactococcus lactis]
MEPVAKKNKVEKEAMNSRKIITKSSGFVFMLLKKLTVFLKKFIKVNYSRINEKISLKNKKKPFGSFLFFSDIF